MRRASPVGAPKTGGLTRRLKDLSEADHGRLDGGSSVLPQSWRCAATRLPEAQATLPPHWPRTRAMGRQPPIAGLGLRYSSIDGLRLPLVEEERPRLCPTSGSRSRSCSRRHRVRRHRRSSQDEALYFVDVLTHRTLARCAACDLGLVGSQENAGAASEPEAASGRAGGGEGSDPSAFPGRSRSVSRRPEVMAVLGFRMALASGGIRVHKEPSRVRWVHASEACLQRLGFPSATAESLEQDIVFSRAVDEVQRADVLRSLLRSCSMPRIEPHRLCLEQWSYAAASSRFWGRASSSLAFTVARLTSCVLQEEALRSMRESGEGTLPLCVICMQEFAVGEEATRLPCLHLFHAACAREWLSRRPVCPLDMTPVYVSRP